MYYIVNYISIKNSIFLESYSACMDTAVRMPYGDITKQCNCNDNRDKRDTVNSVGVERTPEIP